MTIDKITPVIWRPNGTVLAGLDLLVEAEQRRKGKAARSRSKHISQAVRDYVLKKKRESATA